jgi:hypothetical protein
MLSWRRRYAIAISYDHETLEYVLAVCDSLARTVGRNRVLFDKFHEAEFARLDLLRYLRGLYRKADLIVVFWSKGYTSTPWTINEWIEIQEIAATNHRRVMLIKLDQAEVKGLSTGWIGMVSADQKTATEVAELIRTRYDSTPKRWRYVGLASITTGLLLVTVALGVTLSRERGVPPQGIREAARTTTSVPVSAAGESGRRGGPGNVEPRRSPSPTPPPVPAERIGSREAGHGPPATGGGSAGDEISPAPVSPTTGPPGETGVVAPPQDGGAGTTDVADDPLLTDVRHELSTHKRVIDALCLHKGTGRQAAYLGRQSLRTAAFRAVQRAARYSGRIPRLETYYEPLVCIAAGRSCAEEQAMIDFVEQACRTNRTEGESATSIVRSWGAAMVETSTLSQERR